MKFKPRTWLIPGVFVGGMLLIWMADNIGLGVAVFGLIVLFGLVNIRRGERIQ